ncbi:MAG: RNA-binding domain-containing protein [Candidatus Bathyarchaeota archaeon]
MRGVEFTVFTHATEDEDKVERALRNVIPEGTPNVRFKSQTFSGYFKDSITLITATIKRREAAEVLNSTITNLNTLDRERLLDELNERVDDSSNLYIRLDKQKAYQRRLVMEETDPIRIKFRFYPPHGTDSIDYVRSVLTDIIEGER